MPLEYFCDVTIDGQAFCVHHFYSAGSSQNSRHKALGHITESAAQGMEAVMAPPHAKKGNRGR